MHYSFYFGSVPYRTPYRAGMERVRPWQLRHEGSTSSSTMTVLTVSLRFRLPHSTRQSFRLVNTVYFLEQHTKETNYKDNAVPRRVPGERLQIWRDDGKETGATITTGILRGGEPGTASE